jgi:hypothetical protein
MNTQLVDYLVGVITHLSPEEQTLLQQKLARKKVSQDAQQNYQELLQLRGEIFLRRQGKPLTPSPDDVLYQLREERDEQLISAAFGDLSNNFQE